MIMYHRNAFRQLVNLNDTKINWMSLVYFLITALPIKPLGLTPYSDMLIL